MKSLRPAHLLAILFVAGVAPAATGSAQVDDGQDDGVAAAWASRQTPVQPSGTEAAAIYDAVGEGLRALDRQLYDGLPSGADDPQAIYDATGVADERMSRWLDGARPLGLELIRASGMPYLRVINSLDGFTLGPAHLAPLRTTNQSLAILVHDAAVRGDRSTLAELLRAQVVIAVRTATDGTLPSSISAINAIQKHMHSVDGLLDRGAIDAETARRVLEVRALLAEHRDCGVVAAIRAELEAMKTELERVLLIPAAERPAAVVGLRINVPISLDDGSLHAARQGADSYLIGLADAIDAGVAADDLGGARNGIAFAERRLHDGAFGELLKVLAPRLLPVVDLLIELEGGLDSQRVTLESIALGVTPSTAHADAGWYYQRAARETMRIPLDAQAAIEALWAPSAAPTVTSMRIARDAIDARRAAIIEPLLLASRAPRCSFPTHPARAAGSGLVRIAAMGTNGAVRLLLADAFGPGTRPEGAPTRAEAVSVALRTALHFSKLRSHSHSLVAQQIVRDLVQPCQELAARGELTVQVREELLAIVARMPEADPLGFRAATDAERTRLASLGVSGNAMSVALFSQAQLAALPPNTIAFLLAMFTDDADVPFDAPRGGPLDGALVDMRTWFDLAAFKRAHEQRGSVESRASRDRASDPSSDDANADLLAWIEVVQPVDIDARIREAPRDIDRLRQIIDASAAGGGTPARGVSE